MGGFGVNPGAGGLQEHTGSHAIMFLIAGLAYEVAPEVPHLRSLRRETVQLGKFDFF